MNCDKAKELISLYIDNELTETEKTEIERHIESCEECKKEYEEILLVMETLGEMPMLELPKNFKEELHIRLKATKREKANKSKVISLDNFRRWQKPILAVAAVFVLMVVIGPMLNQSGKYEYGRGAVESISYDMAMEDGVDANMVSIDALSDETMAEPSVTSFTIQEKNSKVTTTSEIDEELQARKIIKTGYIGLQISNYDKVLSDISLLTNSLGGYIQNMSTNTKYNYDNPENELKQGYINIRVPDESFDSVIETLKGYGKVFTFSTDSQDITLQYRDIHNEVTNLEVRESKLREIMEKAETIEDVLNVERELSRVRGDINRLKGTLQNWDQLVSLSTINITLDEVEDVENQVNPIDKTVFEKAKEGFIRSINSLIDFSEDLFIDTVAFVPMLIVYSIVGGVLFIIVRKLYRKYRR